jgi:hypothetical protein
MQPSGRPIVLGYSLPPADLTIRGMIVDAIRYRQIRVDIADLYSRQVSDQFVQLGVPLDRITCFDGSGTPRRSGTSR